MARDAIGQGRPDAVAHLDMVAVDRDMALRIDFDRAQRAVRTGAVILGDAGDAGADEDAALRSCLLPGAVAPDRMLLQPVQDLGRADRDGVGIAGHRPAADLEGIAAAKLDRIEGQGRRRLVDEHLQRRHGLECPVAAHRAGGHATRMLGDRGDVDLGNVVDADRAGGTDHRHAGRVVGEASAVEHVVGGERRHPAARPVHPEPRLHLERVPFDPALELLVAILREANRAAGEEDRRQGHIERKRRVIAPPKATAEMGELGVDALRLEACGGLAEKIGDGACGLERGLHAEDELEVAAACIVPGKAAFGLEEHRVDGLGHEIALEHQHGRIVARELSADLLAVGSALGVVGARRRGQQLPDRPTAALEISWADPAVPDRRIDVGRLWRLARNAREAPCAIVGQRHRAGLVREPQQVAIAKRQPRLVESVEGLKEQQRHRLAQVVRRLANRAEQIAGVELGNAGRRFAGDRLPSRPPMAALRRQGSGGRGRHRYAWRPANGRAGHATCSRASPGGPRHGNPTHRASLL